MYTQPATSFNPSLIIFLLDAQPAFQSGLQQRKFDWVQDFVHAMLKELRRRATRDGQLQPAYRFAAFAYGGGTIDLLGSVRGLREVLDAPVTWMPRHTLTGGLTPAIHLVEHTLATALAAQPQQPAPLIFHLTGGQSLTKEDRASLRRIQRLVVPDGPPLLAHIHLAEECLAKPVRDWHTWPGVQRPHEVKAPADRWLVQQASPLPETYRYQINYHGYALQSNSAMYFPAAASTVATLLGPIVV